MNEASISIRGHIEFVCSHAADKQYDHVPLPG